MNPVNKPHRNIYGQYISKNPIGYCHCLSHKGALTPQLLKKHQCGKKQCPYFQKNEEHPYWMQKEKRKKEGKMKKKRLQAQLQ